MPQPSAEDGSVSTSLRLPKVTNEGEDTSSTATLIQAKATEDDTPCGPQLMTQEEMEHAELRIWAGTVPHWLGRNQ